MTERYCEGERFTGLSFAGEIFERCDFADCLFVDYSFTKCELDHTTLNECRFVRCEITGLRSVSSSVQDPEKVETKEVHINEYGTDDYSRLVLTYPGGCKAESVQTIGQELERNARILGTKGSIFLPDFQHAETMTLEVEGKEPEVIRCPVDINGFEYEIREASRCVKLGRTGSDRYTPQDSLALTRLMYDTRMSWGMKFAGEV